VETFDKSDVLTQITSVTDGRTDRQNGKNYTAQASGNNQPRLIMCKSRDVTPPKLKSRKLKKLVDVVSSIATGPA